MAPEGAEQDLPPVVVSRFFQHGRSVAALMALLAAGWSLSIALTGQAHAQGRLDARYEATLAGILVGKGTWVIDVGDDQFSAFASGGSSGLLKAFAGGEGTGASQGRIINGQLAPSSYMATLSSDKKSETIRIQLVGGNIKDSTIDPEPPPTPDRIPVTDAQRRGVIDPMTGSLLRVPGTSDLLSPESCKSASSIFDGRMRYDLRLEYKRTEIVKTLKGYQGPVLVCSIYFTPISGYVPERAAIKYLTSQRNMEVWLAPIAGTRVLAPYKVQVPTPIGMAALEATQFVTTAAVRTTAKTQ
jgi:Protein of unknown function (DUF3108)